MDLQKSFIDYYNYIKYLSYGTTGKIYLVDRLSDNKKIAVKIIDFSGYKYIEYHEINILEILSTPQCNPFISCYYGYNVIGKELFIEMEFIDGNTLRVYAENFRKKRKYKVLYRHLLLICKDVIKGLSYIHQHSIIHKDIKDENIMISKNLTPKIIDFNLACTTKIKNIDNKTYSYCEGFTHGSTRFSSPEDLFDEVAYISYDIQSLDVTIFYSATEEYPDKFHSSTKCPDEITDEYRRCVTNKYKLQIAEEEPKKLLTSNRRLNKLVNNMLIKDHTKRWEDKDVISFLEHI